MRSLIIDRPWGTHLRHWLKRPETFALLDRLTPDDAQFESWDHGGCRVLACAIKQALTLSSYPGHLTLKVIASNESPVDHVVLQATNTPNDIWYLDADGATREPTLLRRFSHRERRTGVKLTQYDERSLDQFEIHCPPYKLARLTIALRRVIHTW